MLCCKSVTSTLAAVETVGILNVPSSFEMTMDLDFAYDIFWARVSYRYPLPFK